MKKAMSLFLALGMTAALLAGCGGSGSSSASAAPAASPLPASLTAEVDLTVCGELLSRTAATLPALVRFAAMHTDDAALLDPVADGGLRALSACAALPNVDDLSGLGVIAASRSVRASFKNAM